MTLARPLTQDQVVAAASLYRHLGWWHLTDGAIRSLRRAMPGFQPQALLLKVVAVNALYYTNVMAVTRMTEHISDILKRTRPDDFTVETVEKVACLPLIPGQKHQRRFISFASKFAHFFIDDERFPIYDYYGVKMVAHHLGKPNTGVDLEHPYAAYVDNLNRLMRESGVEASLRQLDCYLWIVGQYAEWRRRKEAPVNTELRRVFEKGTEQEWELLKRVVGQDA